MKVSSIKSHVIFLKPLRKCIKISTQTRDKKKKVIKMLHKNGPSIETCGTPAVIFSQEVKLLLTQTRCRLSLK